MLTLIRKMWLDESGQGLSEYALIIAAVAVGVTASMIVMREEIIGTFSSASDGMKDPPFAGSSN